MTLARSPLHPGTTIGGYVVEQPLGHGGMADVYLARDLAQTRLVALKVLPADAAQDLRRRDRLQLEGRVLQSLRHPNICSVYEVGDDGDRLFIAMEYLEGRTLHEVAAHQKLGIDRVVEIACQLASALEAARKAGVVHRDFKGSNVMVLPSGEVKVLDFGLAKFASSSEQRLMNPVSRPTDPGLIFGTAEFMSPEQALGREVDHRSDLFSFGVILYELLTGALPFKGGTRMELFYAIMNTPPPPITEVNPAVPQPLATVVERLLEKDARARFQTAEKVLAELEALRPKQSDAPIKRRAAQKRWFNRVAGSAAGIALALVALPFLQAVANWADDAIASPRLFPGSVWSGSEAIYDMSEIVGRIVDPTINWIGNDGRIVYTTTQSRGRTALWLSVPGESAPRLLVRDTGPAVVAPDGETVFFVRAGPRAGLYRTSISGAPPVKIVEGPAERPVVSPDGRNVTFGRRVFGGYTLWAVPAAGGSAYQLSAMVTAAAPLVSPNHELQAIPQRDDVLVCDMPGCSHRSYLPVTRLVSWTPDSAALAHQGPPGRSNIWMTKIEDGSVHQITRFIGERATSIAWSADGHRVAATRRRSLTDVDWLNLFR